MPNVETMTEQTLANYVKTTREGRGLTINEACRRAGLSNTLWRQVEKGEKTSFRDVTLQRVAAGLDIDPRELFRRAGRALPYNSSPPRIASAAEEEEFIRLVEEVAEAAQRLAREARGRRTPGPGTGRSRPEVR